VGECFAISGGGFSVALLLVLVPAPVRVELGFHDVEARFTDLRYRREEEGEEEGSALASGTQHSNTTTKQHVE
jgi:hypothetical protein